MKYLYLAAAVFAAVHAYMFGRWLINNNNKTGGYAAFFVAASCVALSAYRLIMAK